MEDPSPVIGYKPCGREDEKHPLLKEENFLLVLMTQFQADMFVKFCTLACVDSTHKTNEYGYKLITSSTNSKTVLSYRNHISCMSVSLLLGQPVAWAITDVEDTHTYHELFKAVKWRMPDAVIDTLMTNMYSKS